MSDDRVDRLRAHRKRGVDILIALQNATPDTVDAAIARELEWGRDLIPIVEAFGPAAAAPFEPLTPIKAQEQRSLMQALASGSIFSEDHFRSFQAQEVRMTRLMALLDRLPIGQSVAVTEQPTKKPGRPGDKNATKAKYKRWAKEIDDRHGTDTIRSICRDIAVRDGITQDLATFERETRRYRKKRGRKIPR